MYEWWCNGCASMLDLLHTFCPKTADLCVKGHKYHMRKNLWTSPSNIKVASLPAVSYLLSSPHEGFVFQMTSRALQDHPMSFLHTLIWAIHRQPRHIIQDVLCWGKKKKGQSSPGRYWVSVKNPHLILLWRIWFSRLPPLMVCPGKPVLIMISKKWHDVYWRVGRCACVFDAQSWPHHHHRLLLFTFPRHKAP